MRTLTFATIALLTIGTSAGPHRPDGPSPSWYSKYRAAKEALMHSSLAQVTSVNPSPPYSNSYPTGAFHGPPPSDPSPSDYPPPLQPWRHHDFQPLTSLVTKTLAPSPEESEVKSVVSTVIVLTSDAKPQIKVYSSTSTLSTITTTITSSAAPKSTCERKPQKGKNGLKGNGNMDAKEIEEGKREVAKSEVDEGKGAKEVAEGELEEVPGGAEATEGEEDIAMGVSGAEKAAWLAGNFEGET